MNTQLLQQHLANSLTGLAKACENNHRTDQSDRLVIQILSSESLDNEGLLKYIDDVNREKEVITMSSSSSEVNLNTLYSALDCDAVNQTKVWNGLRRIAVDVSACRKDSTAAPDSNSMMEFIYRALKGISENRDYRKTLNEISVIEHLIEA